ncbi:MAG: hypothetical protein IPM74_00690 [Crocinitomicaceae bacterium]|nr:hypothetical protein [Crocinitomicaceae bacterium]
MRAQDGFSMGANVATSFQLNSHRQKLTGIWSSESGYGFAFGVPLRFGYADERAFVTGLDYEYISFDNWVNGSLINSTRFHAVHLPATFQFNLISSLYATAGAGVNYLFRSRYFAPGSNISISSTVQPFQPYLSLGVASIAERGNGIFELSVATRFHFLDLRNKNYINFDAVSSRLISFDLGMKFYF